PAVPGSGRSPAWCGSGWAARPRGAGRRALAGAGRRPGRASWCRPRWRGPPAAFCSWGSCTGWAPPVRRAWSGCAAPPRGRRGAGGGGGGGRGGGGGGPLQALAAGRAGLLGTALARRGLQRLLAARAVVLDGRLLLGEHGVAVGRGAERRRGGRVPSGRGP